jgi:hypothetical protein
MGFFSEDFTSPGQANAPLGAIEQADAEIRLQFLNRTGEGRRLDVDSGCGPREAQLFGDDQKVT